MDCKTKIYTRPLTYLHLQEQTEVWTFDHDLIINNNWACILTWPVQHSSYAHAAHHTDRVSVYLKQQQSAQLSASLTGDR